MGENRHRTEMEDLRFYTTVAILIVFVFSFIADTIDNLFLGNRFQMDPAIITLMGGLIAGLFSAEALSAFRRRGDK